MNERIISRIFSLMLILGVVFISMRGSVASADTLGISTLNSICDPTVEVMPLGDSITTGKFSGFVLTDPDGAGDDIGYRKDLWELLTGAGYSVDFVGSQANGASDPINFSDPQHEGHNGWRDDQIAEYIYNNSADPDADWLSLNPPDVILLHIGTNSLSTDPSDVEDILDEINEYELDTGRSVIVIVARIINWVSHNTNVTTFNNNVAGMVAARPDYGSEVFMVDMEVGAGLNYSIYHEVNNPLGDFIDDLHPYASGYTKMAAVWKAKFDEIYYAFCGTNSPPMVDQVPDQVDDEGTTIDPLLQIEAIDPDGDTLVYVAVGLPPGLSIDASTGEISGIISYTASPDSPYDVTVTVTDTGDNATPVVFKWTIDNTNRSPVVTAPVTQTNDEGATIDPPLQIAATDPDGDSLQFQATNLPSGLSINENTGEISGMIAYDASSGSPYSVNITVNDNGEPSQSASISFIWMVQGPGLYLPLINK